MQITNYKDAFLDVASSFNQKKGHRYIGLLNSVENVKVTSKRSERSSFEKVTQFVRNKLADSAIIPEEKTELAKAYQIILNSFATKKRFIDYIFFVRIISKHKKIRQGRALLQDFHAGKTMPLKTNAKIPAKKDVPAGKAVTALNKKTIDSLEKKGIYYDTQFQASRYLKEAPIGSYAIWSTGLNYCFYQKTTETLSEKFLTSSFSAEEIIEIASSQNIQTEIDRLISKEKNMVILENAGLICANFQEASQKLDLCLSGSFVFFRDQDKFFFLQKVPGNSICSVQDAILVNDNEDPVDVIRKSTSVEAQIAILKKQGRIIESRFDSKLKEDKSNIGQFEVCISNGNILSAYYIDKKAYKSFKLLSSNANIFTQIAELVEGSQQRKKIIDQLKVDGRSGSQADAVEYLADRSAGSYFFIDAQGHLSKPKLCIKLPSLDFPEMIEKEITKARKLPELIKKISSNEQLFLFLKEKKCVSKNAAYALTEVQGCFGGSGFGSYRVWKKDGKIFLLVNTGAMLTEKDAIELNSTENLFAQIERHLPLVRHLKGYASSEKKANQEIEKLEIGGVVFYPLPDTSFVARNTKEYGLKIKVSPNKTVDKIVGFNDLKKNLDEIQAPENFWKFLSQTGYAFDNFAQAEKNGEKSFALWKDTNGTIMISPKLRGLPIINAGVSCPNGQSLQEFIQKSLTSDEAILKVLAKADMVVADFAEAKSKLFAKPLGSFVVWEKDGEWFFLQKQVNQSPISNMPEKFLKGNLFKAIENFTSQSAQINWLKAQTCKTQNSDFAIYNVLSGYVFAYPDIWGLQIDRFICIDVKKDIWEQIDKLTSRETHWNILVKNQRVAKNKEEAMHKSQTANPGGMSIFFWQESGGAIGYCRKVSLKQIQIGRISPNENLLNEINKLSYADWFNSYTPQAKQKDEKTTLCEAKDRFLSVLNPTMKDEEKKKTSFLKCFEMYREAQKATHTDKNVGATGERFNEIIEASKAFEQELQVTLKKENSVLNRVFLEDLDKKLGMQ